MSLSAATKSNAKGFLDLITCHAFNEKRTQVAVGTATEFYIYDCSSSVDPANWTKLHTLNEHTGLVSGLDWNPITDQIVSCGHDRNAYVWNFDAAENKWKPTLCILRINRAATSVKWAPSGLKFAVTSGSKTMPVCSYEDSSNWWVSRLIRKHKSTIIEGAFSPSSHLVATASTDMKCRIASVFDKNYDSRDSKYDHIFDAKQYLFGEIIAEFDQAKAWINTVAWAPNGMTVAFGSQGSTLHFADLSTGPINVSTVFLKDLPMLSSYFVNDTTLVAAGFDKNPAFFQLTNGEWVFKTYAEKEGDSKTAATAASTSSATSRAFAMFQQADSQGTKFGATVGPKVADFTTHKNVITCIRPFANDTSKFTSSGLDGRIVTWDASKYM